MKGIEVRNQNKIQWSNEGVSLDKGSSEMYKNSR